jgi:hypothetical protein
LSGMMPNLARSVCRYMGKLLAIRGATLAAVTAPLPSLEDGIPSRLESSRTVPSVWLSKRR